MNLESNFGSSPESVPSSDVSAEANVDRGHFRENVTAADLWRKEKPSFSYDASIEMPRIKNLHMPGTIEPSEDDGESQGVPSGHIPCIVSALRYKDMADAAEFRYGLPKGIVLAMIAEGSGGVDTYVDPDGAAGVIPIGAYTAKLLGLRVAGGRFDHPDAQGLPTDEDENGNLELRSIIKARGYDRELLVGHDERLHPLASIDAAARRMAAALGTNVNRRIDAPDPMTVAFSDLVLEGSARWADVTHYQELVLDEATMVVAKGTFERSNPDLTIGGVPAGFDEFLASCAKSNARYGVAEYAKLRPLNVIQRWVA